MAQIAVFISSESQYASALDKASGFDANIAGHEPTAVVHVGHCVTSPTGIATIPIASELTRILVRVALTCTSNIQHALR